MSVKPKFFRTPASFREWLETHHSSAEELWVGYYKKGSGKPSITWPESVDEALCFGWIDGVRKSIDADSYMIRFTRRRPRSIWSAVNIKRAYELINLKRMTPAGIKAFSAREENRSGIYSYEQRSPELPEQYASIVKKNSAAWNYLQQQPMFYRKALSWWILSAKKEETRLRRLDKLIEISAKQQRVPPFVAVKGRSAKSQRGK